MRCVSKWLSIAEDEKEEWAKHEDDPSADASGSAWAKDEYEHEDQDLSEVGMAGVSVAKGGFRDLQPEEKSRLLTVPECIMNEIGLHNLNPALSRAHPTPYKMLKHFFHRYLQLDTVDFYIQVEQTQQPRTRPMWIAKVITKGSCTRFCNSAMLARRGDCRSCIEPATPQWES